MESKRICFIGSGSRGDLQPLLAFALSLQKYMQCNPQPLEISFITHYDFKDWIENFKFQFEPITSSIDDFLRNKECAELIAKGKTTQVFSHHCSEEQITIHVRDTVAGLKKIQPHYIICNQASLIFSHIFKEIISAPIALLGFIPLHQTGDFPHPFALTFSLYFRFLNSLTYTIFNNVGLTLVYTNVLKRIRQLHGITTEFSSKDLTRSMVETPMFYAISPSLIPKPQDWPDNVPMGGYFFLDQENETLDTSIEAFLDNGTPPIYYGFGSMPMELSSKFLELLKGLRDELPNERFLVFISLKSVTEEVRKYVEVDPNMMLIGSTCHRLLFPRCKCIIHHGGAGTTAAVARSGTPSVPCTIFADQPFWGSRLVAAGAAPVSLQICSAEKKSLSEAVMKAYEEPFVSTARDLGNKIRNENGNQEAVNWFLAWKKRVDNTSDAA